MHPTDRTRFATLLSNVMAFYRQDVSDFALGVWWQAAQGFDFEQVSRALTAHAVDPERGQFPPRPADLVRLLQGTRADRGLVAWGKALDAAARVGAYATVVFDDPVIHAVVEDLGGWPAFCRTETDDLPFLQNRFCASYRAYCAQGGDMRYPARLIGDHEATNRLNGQEMAPPVLIGKPDAAQRVLAGGSSGPKTQITASAALPRLLAQVKP